VEHQKGGKRRRMEGLFFLSLWERKGKGGSEELKEGRQEKKRKGDAILTVLVRHGGKACPRWKGEGQKKNGCARPSPSPSQKEERR